MVRPQLRGLTDAPCLARMNLSVKALFVALQAQVVLYAAISASSAASVVAVSSSEMGGSNAARMTLAVCWITSKLSASNDALPW
jgi:hypothetical protein